jgi:hypothetical protein
MEAKALRRNRFTLTSYCARVLENQLTFYILIIKHQKFVFYSFFFNFEQFKFKDWSDDTLLNLGFWPWTINMNKMVGSAECDLVFPFLFLFVQLTSGWI